MRIRTLAASLAALTVAASMGTTALAQSPAAEPVTLTAWIGPVFSEAQQKQLDDWAAATGNTIQTEVFPLPFEQNVLTKWATGERPDLLFFHAIGNWLVQLDPETNLQDLSAEPFVQRTIAGLLEKSGSYNGKNYAAVLNYPYLDGVFYNKPLFEQHGCRIGVCHTCKCRKPHPCRTESKYGWRGLYSTAEGAVLPLGVALFSADVAVPTELIALTT